MMESSRRFRVTDRLDGEMDGDSVQKEAFAVARVEASSAGVAVHASRRRDGFLFG